ncbi:UDP-N-acetyl-D-galactosamine dehydrogenase [Acholeplasma morum]|uniref:nucleotide sugar dehydrogenase n=1 Tax=Paracholeplasma morum TaxID=264637 RepID=UPI001957E7B2|nr:nucleotide sugar dehydrogenase [Paracholeplasma morum]MBM7453021.1 UDP-N-acetyl-D-galactosamine dehydrogenase [Paracholeplasma morum]
MNKPLKIAVIGLGYVGLPIAYAFAKRGVDVIGFDVNKHKIELYKKGIDPTNEVGNENLGKVSNLLYTYDENDLDKANFFIVAVPTPVNEDKTPDLVPVIKASEVVSRHLNKGDYVVYESTVYPGVTEDIAVPILERSGLKRVVDFKFGYSPERINPGDKVHRLETITKVVSGCDIESLEHIAKVYEIVVDAGVFKAKSVKVAEAAKVIENSQRDINIAFMNELAIIFDLLNIDTKDVLDAASTKWNFLRFTPGLVGGHCIGVDPYYLTYKAQSLGYQPEVILAGRRINDNMGKYIAEKSVKKMFAHGVTPQSAKVLVMGITFKEDCPDIRNSKVIDIINELKEYGITPMVCDPLADKDEVRHEYGLELVDFNIVKDLDAIILAVSHYEYRSLKESDYKKLYHQKHSKFTLIDVKSITNFSDEFDTWRL